MGRVREKRRVEERRSEKRKSQKREDAGAGKGRKVAKHSVFFQWYVCGSGGSKIRLAKAAGAEPSGQMRDEKLCAVVARSTFPSQNVQNTRCLEHFWKLRCWKSARGCAKHICKWKSYKQRHIRTTFGKWAVEKVHSVAARSTFRSQNVENTTCSDHFWKLKMSKKCTPLWCEAHFEVKMLKHKGFGRLFWRFRCGFAWQAQGIVDLVKSEQNEQNLRVFAAFPKTMAGVGHLKKICKDAFSVYKRHLHQSC